MKIELDLPDWVDNSGVFSFFQGREMVAYKYQNGNWMVKDIRCTRCGECCPDDCKMKEPGINGLYTCKNENDKPFRCCFGPIEGHKEENCKVAYKEM
jgi:hypothetical protein